jgi:hypothetical protein
LRVGVSGIGRDAEQFGGALEIKSSAGNGTTAAVRLPAVALPRGGSACLP